MPTGYRPELDTLAYCDEELAHYYMQQVGVLRWAVKLGRINITAEVSSIFGRFGHFQALQYTYLPTDTKCNL